MTEPDWLTTLNQSYPEDRAPMCVRMSSVDLARLRDWWASLGHADPPQRAVLIGRPEPHGRYNGIPIELDESASVPVWVMPDDDVPPHVELARAMIANPDDLSIRERYREAMGSPEVWPDGAIGGDAPTPEGNRAVWVGDTQPTAMVSRTVVTEVRHTIGCFPTICAWCRKTTPDPPISALVAFVQEHPGQNFMHAGSDWLPRGWSRQWKDGPICDDCGAAVDAVKAERFRSE